MQQRDIDLLLVTPGADLTYLTGYRALPLERLTCLALRSDGQAWMAVPQLELPAAQAHGVDQQGIDLLAWGETMNPYQMLARATGLVKQVVTGNLMWAEKVHGFAEAYGALPGLAGRTISDVRAIKDSDEIAALAQAGRAIDSVHELVPQWLRAGRTEREVGRDIAAAIIDSGHETVDFVIVASGPNGASPHHEVSDRVLVNGDAIVVDIGGTMPSGYCSDSTRTYALGDPGAQYRQHYAALLEAQSVARGYATAGRTCESVDSAARDVLREAGLGEFFIHRTGHGIGLETHEDPYIVSGNDTELVAGHAFSIEPGFYIPATHGARIEDIVVCSTEGIMCLNNTTRELVVV